MKHTESVDKARHDHDAVAIGQQERIVIEVDWRGLKSYLYCNIERYPKEAYDLQKSHILHLSAFLSIVEKIGSVSGKWEAKEENSPDLLSIKEKLINLVQEVYVKAFAFFVRELNLNIILLVFDISYTSVLNNHTN